MNENNIKINNLNDLYALAERMKPDSNNVSEFNTSIIFDTKGTSLSDQNFNGKLTIPQKGGKTLRNTILDGFDFVKKQMTQYEASLASQNMTNEYAGYMPAVYPNPEHHRTWLDKFLSNLGGRRSGLSMVWDLPEGTFKLDPWTCNIEKVS